MPAHNEWDLIKLKGVYRQSKLKKKNERRYSLLNRGKPFMKYIHLPGD